MKKGSLRLDYKYKNTSRINNLRFKALNTKPSVCVERARYFTESYKNTDGMDPLLRKALALKNLLNKMTIYIEDDQLIIGNNSSKTRASVIAPEYSSKWIAKEIHDSIKAPDKRLQDKHEISEMVKNMLDEEIIPYWIGKTVEDRVILVNNVSSLLGSPHLNN